MQFFYSPRHPNKNINNVKQSINKHNDYDFFVILRHFRNNLLQKELNTY